MFPLICRCSFPLIGRCSDDVIVDTDEDSMLSSEVPGKQLIDHSDTTHVPASALVYCIKTTRFKLLCVAVVEPTFLCMTCHCHSN